MPMIGATTASDTAQEREGEMDNASINEIRQRAQVALSRARLAGDPEIKDRWQQIANAWLMKLAHLGVVERARPTPTVRVSRGCLGEAPSQRSATAGV